MSRRVGIWIDRRKAVVVTLDNGEASVETIESGAPGRVRLSGGARSSTPYGPQDVASDSQRDAKYRKHMTAFYRSLIGVLREAEAFYIFGPGEAKGEFRREVEKVKPLRGKIAAVETADKMTDAQVAAAVKSFFAKR